jgi:hypothetical protein
MPGRRNCKVHPNDLRLDRPNLDCNLQQPRGTLANFQLDETAGVGVALRGGQVRVQPDARSGEEELGSAGAERTYGIAEDALTPAQGWSLAKLRKRWNRHKNTVAPWWEANSKEAYNCGLDGLARGLAN